MSKQIKKVVWTRQAREALNEILDYRYRGFPKARKIVREDIIGHSKGIVFGKQYQKDEYFPQYRKITVRDYRILYREDDNIVYIMNVVCSKAEESNTDLLEHSTS